MRLSHSRLSTLVANPKKYKLIYKLGFGHKEKSTALQIGSAVHEGIELENENLDAFFQKHGTFEQRQGYSFDQLLSESMVHGYLNCKDKIMDDILTDIDSGEKLVVYEVLKELRLTAELPSLIEGNEPHSFLGYIDLLILTNKGWIVIDYKTSTYRPKFDEYLEQIYRYMFLTTSEFPEMPIYKVGIINLRKASIRQKRTETPEAFKRRLRLEYELNEDNYINHHIYTPESIDKDLMRRYIENLSQMADFAEHVDAHELYWWGYSDFWGKDFYDLAHGLDDAWIAYNIDDYVYNEKTDTFDEFREAKAIDMFAIDNSNVLHKYEQFEMQALAYFAIMNNVTKDKLFSHLTQNFETDLELLELHWLTLQKKLETQE